MDTGQAGTQESASEGAESVCELEVTPEMIQAGVVVLENYGESYPEQELAIAVYTAMLGARKQESRQG